MGADLILVNCECGATHLYWADAEDDVSEMVETCLMCR